MNEKQKHTPGPWHEVEVPESWTVEVPAAPNFTTVGVGPENGQPVAVLVDMGFHGWGNISAEGAANLNLIAAAPALLIAAKLALPALEAAREYLDEQGEFTIAINEARAAIARAEGGGEQ